MTRRGGDEPVCDECGHIPAPLKVDSPLGLALWSLLRPNDPRTALWYCTERCIWDSGQRLAGEVLKRQRDG